MVAWLWQHRPWERTGAAAPQPTLCREWDLLRGHFPVQGARPWAPPRSARLSPPAPAPCLTGLRLSHPHVAGAQCPCQTLESHQGPCSPPPSTPWPGPGNYLRPWPPDPPAPSSIPQGGLMVSCACAESHQDKAKTSLALACWPLCAGHAMLPWLTWGPAHCLGTSLSARAPGRQAHQPEPVLFV